MANDMVPLVPFTLTGNIPTLLGPTARPHPNTKIGAFDVQKHSKQALDSARNMFQAATGKRFPAINDAIPAPRQTSRSPTSQHYTGRAFDISVRGLNNSEKIALVSSLQMSGFKGIGLGQNFVHADTRSRPAVWGYLPSGKDAPPTVATSTKNGWAGIPARDWDTSLKSGSLPQAAINAVNVQGQSVPTPAPSPRAGPAPVTAAPTGSPVVSSVLPALDTNDEGLGGTVAGGLVPSRGRLAAAIPSRTFASDIPAPASRIMASSPVTDTILADVAQARFGGVKATGAKGRGISAEEAAARETRRALKPRAVQTISQGTAGVSEPLESTFTPSSPFGATAAGTAALTPPAVDERGVSTSSRTLGSSLGPASTFQAATTSPSIAPSPFGATSRTPQGTFVSSPSAALSREVAATSEFTGAKLGTNARVAQAHEAAAAGPTTADLAANYAAYGAGKLGGTEPAPVGDVSPEQISSRTLGGPIAREAVLGGTRARKATLPAARTRTATTKETAAQKSAPISIIGKGTTTRGQPAGIVASVRGGRVVSTVDPNTGLTRGGPGGVGGQTHLCTLAFNAGKLDADVWAMDGYYGILMSLFNPRIYRGYSRWAKPFARWLQYKPVIEPLVCAIVVRWARYMAWRMAPSVYPFSLAGWLINAIGMPFCWKEGGRRG